MLVSKQTGIDFQHLWDITNKQIQIIEQINDRILFAMKSITKTSREQDIMGDRTI